MNLQMVRSGSGMFRSFVPRPVLLVPRYLLLFDTQLAAQSFADTAFQGRDAYLEALSSTANVTIVLVENATCAEVRGPHACFVCAKHPSDD